MTKEQFLDLDRWTIFNIYFRPRDKKGELVPPRPQPDEPKRLSPREEFYEHWRGYGAADWMIAEWWLERAAKLQAEREAKKQRRRGPPPRVPEEASHGRQQPQRHRHR